MKVTVSNVHLTPSIDVQLRVIRNRSRIGKRWLVVSGRYARWNTVKAEFEFRWHTEQVLGEFADKIAALTDLMERVTA